MLEKKIHEIFLSCGFLSNVPTGRKLAFLTCKWGGSSPNVLRRAQIVSCVAVCSVLPSSSSYSGCSWADLPLIRRDSLGLHSEDASRILCHFWEAEQTWKGTLYWACLAHVVPSSDRHDCGDEAVPETQAQSLRIDNFLKCVNTALKWLLYLFEQWLHYKFHKKQLRKSGIWQMWTH